MYASLDAGNKNPVKCRLTIILQQFLLKKNEFSLHLPHHHTVLQVQQPVPTSQHSLEPVLVPLSQHPTLQAQPIFLLSALIACPCRLVSPLHINWLLCEHTTLTGSATFSKRWDRIGSARLRDFTRTNDKEELKKPCIWAGSYDSNWHSWDTNMLP
jgi:hypothetical protein